jgi:hypothetical protein
VIRGQLDYALDAGTRCAIALVLVLDVACQQDSAVCLLEEAERGDADRHADAAFMKKSYAAFDGPQRSALAHGDVSLGGPTRCPGRPSFEARLDRPPDALAVPYDTSPL